ncbi:MAG TPA: beta-propeller fold lactonase family protein [Terracidiphilus sp.]|jgi:DNA-binding beta-propeller fold protein YncE|nr:beta-propeller fold lactonase family protein [Terracidiphilus sp.]
MKFSKLSRSLATGLRRKSGLGQLFLVSAIGLLVATFLTACQLVTIDYVFVATAGSGSSNGAIDTYAADSQSGALRKGAASVSSGGVNPVAMAVSADYTNMYVAHTGGNSIVHFAIAANGVLGLKDTVTLTDPPTALAVNSAGTYLYVVSGTTTATLTEYALTAGSGAIGAPAAQIPLQIPGFTTDAVVPTGVAVLANNSQIQGNAVFATVYDQSAYNPGGTTTSTAHPGWIFGFGIGSGGALTASAGSPYEAGVKPSGLVTDPTDRFVYVTDFASNQLIGYGIHSGSLLSFLINGPFKTGNEPQAIAIDPRGKFLYVANALDSSVSAYVIDLSTGTPSAAVNPTGNAINSTDTEPFSLAVDPALGRFVYTANFIGDSVSGFRIDPNAGNLAPTQATPYPSDQKPTALAIVPHGNHSTQSVTP